MTIEEDGKGVLLPTIINGKRVSDKEAYKHYRETGEHMGIFKTEKDADNYDKDLHNKMGWNGAPGSSQEKWQKSGSPAPAKPAGDEVVHFKLEDGRFATFPNQKAADAWAKANGYTITHGKP